MALHAALCKVRQPLMVQQQHTTTIAAATAPSLGGAWIARSCMPGVLCGRRLAVTDQSSSDHPHAAEQPGCQRLLDAIEKNGPGTCTFRSSADVLEQLKKREQSEANRNRHGQDDRLAKLLKHMNGDGSGGARFRTLEEVLGEHRVQQLRSRHQKRSEELLQRQQQQQQQQQQRGNRDLKQQQQGTKGKLAKVFKLDLRPPSPSRPTTAKHDDKPATHTISWGGRDQPRVTSSPVHTAQHSSSHPATSTDGDKRDTAWMWLFPSSSPPAMLPSRATKHDQKTRTADSHQYPKVHKLNSPQTSHAHTTKHDHKTRTADSHPTPSSHAHKGVHRTGTSSGSSPSNRTETGDGTSSRFAVEEPQQVEQEQRQQVEQQQQQDQQVEQEKQVEQQQAEQQQQQVEQQQQQQQQDQQVAQQVEQQQAEQQQQQQQQRQDQQVAQQVEQEQQAEQQQQQAEQQQQQAEQQQQQVEQQQQQQQQRQDQQVAQQVEQQQAEQQQQQQQQQQDQQVAQQVEEEQQAEQQQQQAEQQQQQ
ncbi:putative mediator of RNA polymerase II transcription subunit 26 isoform X2 [Sycon ciliatum]|uniref:putative mediator of RNA polymerase II transcription subunit 26 isoform X2 n=1 Tax=Sycon ciliatum TaxID=27933 RepID=UPI0031F63F7F